MQLTLPIQLPVDETFDTFYSANNEQLIHYLKGLFDASKVVAQTIGPPLTLINAPQGTGKSHLLFALCHYAECREHSAIYLDLSAIHALEPSIFDGLEGHSLICLDNIHTLAASANWEIALFDLVNRVIEHNHRFPVRLVMSCLHPLPHVFELADLVSRLAWGTVFHLISPSDDEKRLIVKLRAEQLGLRLSNNTYNYLLSHASRDLPSLIKILGELDDLSLTQKRNINVALLKEVLQA